MLAVMLPMLFIVSCSDDDAVNDYEQQLVGLWVEDTKSEYEVYNIEFRADKTGDQWMEFYGEVEESSRISFTWNATETTITALMKQGGTSTSSTVNYVIQNNKLHISQGGESVVYIRK